MRQRSRQRLPCTRSDRAHTQLQIPVGVPRISGQTLASRFSRRSDAEVQDQIPGRVRSAYAFIKAHRDRYSVQMMCRVLEVAVSGYYDWLKQPISNHAQADAS
jgi:hypothetical protein